MLDELGSEYLNILTAHLEGEGEAAYLHAYEFARKCLRAGLAPDDVMSLHVDLVENHLPANLREAAAARAHSLLLEIVVAFSMSYRQMLEERERANQKLEQISRFKTRMVSMVAHDLTNHMTAARLIARSLVREAEGAKMRDRVTHLLSAIDEQQHLIDNLLDISRIEQGRLQLNLRAVPLLPEIERCLERQRKIATDYTFRLEGPSIDVHVDPSKLQQILDNLLGNAVKYSREGSEIVVRVTPEDGMAVVAIRDQGQGISPEDLSHLFEPFYRGSNASRSAIPGSGLGLAIVRSLVEMQGGTISADSELEEGSTFRFTVPLEVASVPGPTR